MRIAQIASLLSRDGAYGGPLTVSLMQCEALSQIGHEVTLFVGWDGLADSPISDSGLTIIRRRSFRLVRTRGITGRVAPGILISLIQGLEAFDVAHVHYGRDLTALCAAEVAIKRCPTVLQTHGMVSPSSATRARIIDGFLVRRALVRSRMVLSLTDTEDAAISEVSRGAATVRRLLNGVASSTQALSSVPRRLGDPVIVLFCSRMHARKRPLVFVEIACMMRKFAGTIHFRMAGPDDGELESVLREIGRAREMGVNIEYLGALGASDAVSQIAAADVVMLPSINEPFPMTVLEAMAAGVPTVITKTCGIADLLRREGASVVSEEHATSLTEALMSLLHDPKVWSQVREAGLRLTTNRLSASAVARHLEQLYSDALD